MHAFAREQQPPDRWTSPANQRPALALNVAASTEHTSPQSCACVGGCSSCESRLSRKASSTVDSKAGSAIGPSIGLLIDSSRGVTILPAVARQKLSSIPAATLQRIRVHDDKAAHRAAEKLNARAFTIGPSIYFGRGEYRPASHDGMRVLAHEAAHAHQQANTSLPPTDQLVVSDPSSKEEQAADKFAGNLSNRMAAPPPAQVSSGSLARLMRVTFEGTAEEPDTNDVEGSIRPAAGAENKGFAFGWSYPTLFNWHGSATIRGTPAPGSDWRIGIIQTLKDYWMRIWWQGHSCVYSYSDQMIKDSTTSKGDIVIIKPAPGCPELKSEEPWFNYCSKSQPFVQDGQKQDVSIEDSPGFLYVPYRKPANNPNASGHFDFGATFFAFLSAYNSGAQQSPDEPRFQHLKRVYWQTMLAGTFNGGLPQVTDGGQTKALEVQDYTPDGPQPATWGITASELLSPVANCVSQEPTDAEGEQYGPQLR